MHTKQFKLKEDGFNEIKKKLLLRTLPIMLVAVAVGVAIGHFYSKEDSQDFSTLPFMIPVAVFVVCFSVFRSIKRQKELLESYTLTIDDTSITREQKDTPAITLSKWDINYIRKNTNGSYTIQGNNSLQCIMVPAQLDNFSELEESLLQFAPPTNKPVSFLQKYALLFSLLGIGLVAINFLSKDKVVVTASGAILIGLFSWSLYQGYNSPNIDQKTRKGLLWIVLVTLLIAARIVMAWLNGSYLD